MCPGGEFECGESTGEISLELLWGRWREAGDEFSRGEFPWLDWCGVYVFEMSNMRMPKTF